MQFKRITKKDLPLIKHYLADVKDLNSFYSLGILYGWRAFTKLEYYLYDETILFRGYNYTTEKIYFFPVGKNIDGMLAQLESPYTLMTIPEDYAKMHYEDAYYDINDFDYIYDFSDLLSLKGKRHEAARNNLNHFLKQYVNYQYQPITRKNINDIKTILQTFNIHNPKKLIEQKINHSILNDFFQLDLFGGILYINNLPIAFTIAEKRNDILFMHFEKGFHNLYRGCLEMLRTTFLESLKNEKITMINREEDVGDPGLRIAKHRLGPTTLVYKYIIHR